MHPTVPGSKDPSWFSAQAKNVYAQPSKKTRKLNIKVVARRLKEMSYKIPLLGGKNSKSLDDNELTDILVRMCPQAWRVNHAKKTAGLQEDPTLDYSIKYLETLEHTSALVQTSNLAANDPSQVKITRRQKGKEWQIC